MILSKYWRRCSIAGFDCARYYTSLEMKLENVLMGGALAGREKG